MPQTAPGNCVGECALNVSAYIREVLYTSNSGGNSSSASSVTTTVADQVSEEARVERFNLGKSFWEQAAIGCNTCHGDILTTNGSPGGIVDPANFNTWESLRDYISANMPQDGEGRSPNDCTTENGCAQAVADALWNGNFGFALTSKNGVNSGVKIQVENRFAQDTYRLKTYDMLLDDFARIFGDAPAVLEGSAPAFVVDPDFWHAESQIGAVPLNILVNAAIESCNGEVLPAINQNELATACADWANRMWLRDATASEIQSCVDVALIDTAGLETRSRATYACVSMMIALPALTF
jgi:hypothetical protein